MSRIWQICLRELRAYFLSPIAYVLLTAFLFLNGYIFYLILNAFSRPGGPSGSVMQVFLGRNIFFWIIVLLYSPAITMRLFAEERRSGTLEVLMTAPVTDAQAVLGKFFGAFLFYSSLWAPTLFYVAVLRRFGSVELGPIMSGYLCILLVGAMFLSVGLLISILTRSQIVAAIISFVLMFLLFIAPVFLEGQLSGSPVLQKICSYTNIWNHAGDFSKGIVDSRNLIYYLSSTALMLFLSVWTLAGKKGQ